MIDITSLNLEELQELQENIQLRINYLNEIKFKTNFNTKYLIYKHTAPNGLSYIGLTQNSIEQRAGSNGHNYYENKKFKQAIDEFGWDNIKHEILVDNIDNLQEAHKLEREYILKYDTMNNGLNNSIGGEGGQSPYVTREIYQIDYDLNIVNKFPTQAAAATALNLTKQNFSRILSDGFGTLGGYYWVYVDEYTPDWKPKTSNKINCKKAVKCLETGKIYPSAAAAAKDYNGARSGVSRVVKGECKTFHGHHFEYLN